MRDELDDEDSEEDPDFTIDVVNSDEEQNDNDLDDAPLPRERLLTASHLREHSLPASLAPRQELNPTLPHLPGQEGHDEDEDPRFEVESLSTNDDERDPFEEAVTPNEPPVNCIVSEDPLPRFNCTDDEDDPDFTLDNADIEVDNPEVEPEEWNIQEQTQNREYIEFLLGLAAQDEYTKHHRVGSIVQQGSQERIPPVGKSALSNLHDADILLDDDDDFDYLRESAMIQDDPLEFRDDLHVSRKEVAQLLFNNESTLRRRTRTSSQKRAHFQSSRRPRVSKQQAAPEIGTLLQVAPILQANPLPIPISTPVPGTVRDIAPSRQQTPAAPPLLPHKEAPDFVANPMQPLIHPPAMSFFSIMPAQLHAFKDQMSVHLQLLAHFHATILKIARTQQKNSCSGSAESDPTDEQSASITSEKLLRRLINNKRVSTSYHYMLSTHVERLKSFAERLLHPRDQNVFNHKTIRSSIYDFSSIDLLEPFLDTCENANPSELPGLALQPFKTYFRPAVAASLRIRLNRRQYNMSGAPEGWYAWTVQDDKLLAMTIAKYGRDFGDFSRDLLPHRLVDDCHARVRYLTSRRCGDNPVKRQVTHTTTPLNRDELKLVEAGLSRYGGRTDDPEVWKQIQRNILPSREWSHLQKLWLWREARRRYKANYRAKLSKKKALEQAGAAQ